MKTPRNHKSAIIQEIRNNRTNMKQKTAMQIMWEGLHNTHPEQWSSMLTHDKEKLLQLEREQIEEAASVILPCGQEATNKYLDPSDYYQQKYEK